MKANKLEKGMSPQEKVLAMCGGNPGAVQAGIGIITEPRAEGVLEMLDAFGIYGTDLYVLYNDKCGRNPNKLNHLLTATSLGLFPKETLILWSKDQPNKLSFTEAVYLDLLGKLFGEKS